MAYREFQIYNSLAEEKVISQLQLYTYKSNDFKHIEHLEDIGALRKDYVKVFPPPKCFDTRLGRLVYQFVLPLLYFREISKADILKTNQLSSAIPCSIHAFFSGRPVYYRTGFSLVKFSRNQRKFFRSYFWSIVQKIILRQATVCAAASKDDLQEYSREVEFTQYQKYSWLPNFINMQKFNYSDHSLNQRNRLIYIGRLNEQKNILRLVEAAHKAGVGVDLYGDGELKQILLHTSVSIGADVRYFDPIPNSKIPELLERYSVFALCSHYEGTPKTLIEAMACGILTVVTPVEGIRSIADTEKSVVAKSTASEDLSDAITNAIRMSKCDYLDKTKKARRFVEKHYSLAKVIEIEKQNLSCCITLHKAKK